MAILQTTGELEQHLNDHIEFLQSSADAFDHGYKSEAKRLAVSLRVLLHDTRSSKSLLGQLDKKDAAFINTATPVEDESVSSHCGLAMISATSFEAEYIAPLDSSIIGADTWLIFEDWWNAIVFIDKERREISRKELVLKMANQDGGAHVDPRLDEKYAALSRHNSMGWVQSDGVSEKPLEGPEKAAIRQIAHEVLKTLIPGYKKKGQESPKEGIIFGGAEIFPNSTIEDVKRKSKVTAYQSKKVKIGRNQACPCGSGIKYKKCHGKVS